jgi:DNA (cytosine-5)-methyltransferase 1
LPQQRLPIPQPERVARVPKKYLDRVGIHDAHPGTGKGYRAAQQWAAE